MGKRKPIYGANYKPCGEWLHFEPERKQVMSDYDPNDPNDYIPEGDGCPRCGSLDVAWQGGDTVVNVGGAATFTRVDWYTCEECGHKWSKSEDYE